MKEKETDPGSRDGMKRDWLIAVVIFLVLWSFCLVASTIFLMTHWELKALLRAGALSLGALLFLGYSLYFLREDFYDAMRKQWLCGLLIAMHIVLLVLAKCVTFAFDTWPDFFIMAVFPSALVPALISNMLGRRAGICTAMVLAFLGPIIIGGSSQFDYFIFMLICSLVAIASYQKIHFRLQFLFGGLWLFIATFVLILFFTWQNNLDFAEIPWFKLFIILLINVMVVILGMLLFPTVCERIFDVTTVFTLNELNTRDHPLLERLLKQAPGTYEHSLAVARLASDAARAIGANARLAETCAYFHDIGKLIAPKKFAENLLEGDENPHDKMTPFESAEILREHIRYGLELVTKAHLPHEVREAVAQHHGTSIMPFFADKAIRQAEEAGKEPPNMADYSYPGPLPHRTEVVLVSIADVCEAAIRASMQKQSRMTSEQLREKVIFLVREKLEAWQFKEANLNLSQLHIIIDSIVETFCVMNHLRPEYPSDK